MSELTIYVTQAAGSNELVLICLLMLHTANSQWHLVQHWIMPWWCHFLWYVWYCFVIHRCVCST